MAALRGMLLGAAALAVAAGAAVAQEAQDSLRVAVANPISTVFVEANPDPETDLASRAVFDGLVCYDHRRRDFAPLLARSWTTPDDRTIEFKLRRDVTFHDGSPLTADDVVYSLDYLRDPTNRLRFAAQSLSFIASVEKVDAETVRVVAKGPTAVAMLRLAGADILPAKLHAGLADKSAFGRTVTVGTGPYRVISVDPTQGVRLERNAAYHGSDCKPTGSIGHALIEQIPDAQTRIAQLMTGGIDLMRATTRDEADLLQGNPAIAVTASEGISFYFMSIDAAGRSGNQALTKLKVRQAMADAIDRAALARDVVPGGPAVRVMDALCLPNQRGCAQSVKPSAYDPAAAKALLAAAGYPGGFDAEITAVPNGGTVAEAVAGELRKIGIRASVDTPNFAGYRARQRDGKAQIIVGLWTLGGLPDVSPTTDYFFDGGVRDYARDADVIRWGREGIATLDEGKREAIYRKLFDRVAEMVYVLPLTTGPTVFIHARDLAVAQGSFSNYGADLYEMRWK